MVGLLAASACGAPAPSSLAATAAEPDVRSVLPDGASLVVLIRARELFEAEPSALAIRGLVRDEQLESIRVQHGIDPRTLDRIAFGTYESIDTAGHVLVLQGPFRAEVAVAEIAHRMVPRESSATGPLPRAGGLLHGTRMDALAVGAHTLVLVFGPPALTARVTRTLEGTSPPAVAGAVQQALARRSEPFVAMRPIPLDLPPGGSVALLLSEEQSLVVAATPVAPDHVRISVELSGGFPPGADENFRRLVVSLAQSTMGTALGLRSALGTLEVGATPTTVELSADLDADELGRGLGLIFRAEIAEALGEAGGVDPPEGPSSTDN